MASTNIIKGFAFPFRTGSDGCPQPAYDDQVLHDSLKQLAHTQQNERVMRSKLGMRTQAQIFEAPTARQLEVLSTEFRAAARTYEPRVIVQVAKAVRVENDAAPESLTGVDMEVSFVAVPNRTTRTLNTRIGGK